MNKNIRKFEYAHGKFVHLHYKSPFIAEANTLTIKFDEYFDRFSLEEQRAIIWHELYHRKYNGTRFPLLSLKLIFKKSPYNADQLLEFEADEYSAKNNGKEAILSSLKKIKKMVEDNLIPYNYKRHPTIDERIERIRRL